MLTLTGICGKITSRGYQELLPTPDKGCLPLLFWCDCLYEMKCNRTYLYKSEKLFFFLLVFSHLFSLRRCFLSELFFFERFFLSLYPRHLCLWAWADFNSKSTFWLTRCDCLQQIAPIYLSIYIYIYIYIYNNIFWPVPHYQEHI